MSVKGKEKAAEPVVVVSDSEDEAANFFVRKRKRPVPRPRECPSAIINELMLTRSITYRPITRT